MSTPTTKTLAAKPTTAALGYFWDERLCARDTGATCPEKAERLRVLAPRRVLAPQSAPDGVEAEVVSGFAPCEPLHIAAVHAGEYIEQVRAAGSSGRRFLDNGDTRATPDVFEQASLAAGAGCAAVDAVLGGQLRRAFCAIRPPGHHANAVRAMGYCIFNNAAIAARYAQRVHGVERVLIVDWDNDPGNGTQEIFWHDPSVFTLSIHQENLFPAAGGVELTGAEAGNGFSRNVPMPLGVEKAIYFTALETAVRQTASRFEPHMLIIAAGFDAHHREPRSRMPLVETDFADMTRIVLEHTQDYTGGRTVSLLEGGYNVATLQMSVREHCRGLAAGGRT